MKKYQVTIRFHLDKPEERRAADFLQGLDRKRFKSCNHFLIELVNSYLDKAGQEQQEDALIEKIRQMFREEIQDIAIATPTASQQESPDLTLTAEEKAANAANVLAGLEMFG